MLDDLKSNLASRLVSECPDIIRRLMLDLDMDGITLPGVTEEDGSESFEQRFSRSAHAYAEYLIETDLEAFQSSDSAHFKVSIRAPLLEDFYKIAVTKDWRNVQIIPEDERTEPILILAAKQDTGVLRYLTANKQSPSIKMVALKSFVRDCSFEIKHDKWYRNHSKIEKALCFILMYVVASLRFIQVIAEWLAGLIKRKSRAPVSRAALLDAIPKERPQ